MRHLAFGVSLSLFIQQTLCAPYFFRLRSGYRRIRLPMATNIALATCPRAEHIGQHGSDGNKTYVTGEVLKEGSVGRHYSRSEIAKSGSRGLMLARPVSFTLDVNLRAVHRSLAMWSSAIPARLSASKLCSLLIGTSLVTDQLSSHSGANLSAEVEVIPTTRRLPCTTTMSPRCHSIASCISLLRQSSKDWHQKGDCN